MATEALISSLSALQFSECYALVKYGLAATDPDTMHKTLKTVAKEGSPRHTRDMCYYLLNKTSRSFARVIQELDSELRHPVCIFYLVLRGLDTIEDDMTIPLEKKLDVLANFHKSLYQRGWKFTENGPDEKDRELCAKFDIVIEEFLNMKEEYQTIIADIAKRMAAGMAEFRSDKKVITLDDYNLYTHYVAGLVGLGLTGLFAASGLESPSLANQTVLANHMGLFLQKVNIMKDFKEDWDEGRWFWPQEIWKDYVPAGGDLGEFTRPENLDRGLACLNHLCADALDLVPDCLEYLSLLQNQTVFQFAAIPQVMAIASIALFFNNAVIFQRAGLKIRRGLAVKLILGCNSFDSVKDIYRGYIKDLTLANDIRVGSNPYDKSFLRVGQALSKATQWLQRHDLAYASKSVSKTSSSWADMFLTILVLVVAVLLAFSFIPRAQ
ncbi:squalene synthase [Synchytrium microbalum]|uniref:Squalene synthase n=1 Tax=Synchytrium microbalum TaxID=1806994 RepID=A0A507BYA5_9FUNG|nr:squalene synthase [Synchytrium microbalum]TPX32108.1 squalene synthase [Synchytrium microbalum]